LKRSMALSKRGRACSLRSVASMARVVVVQPSLCASMCLQQGQAAQKRRHTCESNKHWAGEMVWPVLALLTATSDVGFPAIIRLCGWQ
jgi:hypothetical protein